MLLLLVLALAQVPIQQCRNNPNMTDSSLFFNSCFKLESPYIWQGIDQQINAWLEVRAHHARSLAFVHALTRSSLITSTFTFCCFCSSRQF
jgi:hypothetical protein